jgi:hypothetical protein
LNGADSGWHVVSNMTPFNMNFWEYGARRIADVHVLFTWLLAQMMRYVSSESWA